MQAGIQNPPAKNINGYIPAGNPVSVTVANPDYWDDVIRGMNEVVQGPRGTARRTGLNAPYEYAGKSGTAQVVSKPPDEEETSKEEVPEELRDHAWFIAFAPLEHPKIAVAILVEHGGGGSSSAAPIARRLFDYYLEQVKHD